MKTGFQRRSESNVQVYVDIGDPYPGRAEFIEYFEFANPAFQTPGIKTWGGNNYGQLGFGTTTDTSTPMPVGALANWKQASAGGLHGAAVKYDGTLWAWGHNGYGQIGDSTLTNRSSPVKIGNRTDWLQVSCGFTHTLAISQDGNLWAWGSGIYGQLGVTSMPTIVDVLTSGTTYTVPTSWSNTNNSIECIGGGSGNAYGTNANGGGGGAYSKVVNISLTSGSTLYMNIGAGGPTSYAQNNQGGNTWVNYSANTPPTVIASGVLARGGVMAPNSQAASIGTIRYNGGQGGITTYAPGGGGGGAGGPGGTGGSGSGSGLNNYGGGGGGGAGGGASAIATVTLNGAAGGNGPGGTGGGAGGVAPNGAGGNGSNGGGGGGSGSYSTGGGGPGGNGSTYTITAWGSGIGPGSGGGGGISLGAGGGYGGGGGGGGTGGTGAQGVVVVSYVSNFTSSPLQVGTSNTWVQVSAGGYHSLGIQQDYTTWAWGANGFSQCGVAGVNIPTPTQLLDETANILYSRSLAAGWTQSLAISPGGKLYAWGDGSYGQLGNGSLSVVAYAQQVGALNTWKSISSHGVSSGGILDDGSLYTWGFNGQYNLGLGDNTNRSSPVKIGRNDWQEISMGLYHSVAVKYDGSLWTWGYNASGELGNNTSGGGQYVTTPAQITGLTNWKRAIPGGNHVEIIWPLNGNVDIAAQGFTVSIAVATDF